MFSNFPATAKADQRLPKEKLLSHSALKPAAKKIIREQLGFLALRYKLNPATVNLLPSDAVPGINVFEVHLKDGAQTEKLLTALDELFPYHTLYLLRDAGQRFSLAIRYKRKNAAGDIKAPDYAPWYVNGEVSPDALPLIGPTTDAAYEGIVLSLAAARLVRRDGATLADDIERSRQRERVQAEIATLTKRMYAEKQPRRKQELFLLIQVYKNKLNTIDSS